MESHHSRLAIRLNRHSLYTMFELLQPAPIACCDGMNRRTMLHIGGLASLGLSLPQLLAMGSKSTGSFGRAKRVLMLFMWGGPSHIDLFDMKPEAPTEVRGPFVPVSSKVPGLQITN